MLFCPGFPADDDEEEEEEEVVHLLLYIPYYSGSVDSMYSLQSIQVQNQAQAQFESTKTTCTYLPTYLYTTAAGAVIKLYCTPLHSNLQSTSQKSSRESHISYSALKVTLLNKYIET